MEREREGGRDNYRMSERESCFIRMSFKWRGENLHHNSLKSKRGRHKKENEREKPPWERSGFNKQQEEGEHTEKHTDRPTPDLLGLPENQEKCRKANETIPKNLDKHMSAVNAMTVG